MANLDLIELSELLEKLDAMWLKRPLINERAGEREFLDIEELKLSSLERRETVYLEGMVSSETGDRP